MKSLKLALVGASFLLAAAGAASAADVYQRGSLKDTGDAYLPPITWTGFYAGVHAGGAFGGEIEFSEGPESIAFDLDSAFTGGIHLGYNWQASSNWVVGVEGSVSFLGLEAEDAVEAEGGELSDYLASIRGRAGVAFDQNLVYGTAGVAFLGYADDAADAFNEDVAVGFVVGAGWERKLGNNLSFGVEGLYYNVGSEVEDVEIDTDFFTVTARLNYHFNSGYSDPLK